MLKIFKNINLEFLFLRKYEIEDYTAPNFHLIDCPDLQQGSL